MRKMRFAQLFAICASSADFDAHSVDIIGWFGVFDGFVAYSVGFTKCFGVFDGFVARSVGFTK